MCEMTHCGPAPQKKPQMKAFKKKSNMHEAFAQQAKATADVLMSTLSLSNAHLTYTFASR